MNDDNPLAFPNYQPPVPPNPKGIPVSDDPKMHKPIMKLVKQMMTKVKPRAVRPVHKSIRRKSKSRFY